MEGRGGVEKVLFYVYLCKYVSMKNAMWTYTFLGLASELLGIVLTSNLL